MFFLYFDDCCDWWCALPASLKELSACPTEVRMKSKRERMMNFMRYSTLAKHFWIGSWFSLVETWSVKCRRHVRRPL